MHVHMLSALLLLLAVLDGHCFVPSSTVARPLAPVPVLRRPALLTDASAAAPAAMPLPPPHEPPEPTVREWLPTALRSKAIAPAVVLLLMHAALRRLLRQVAASAPPSVVSVRSTDCGRSATAGRRHLPGVHRWHARRFRRAVRCPPRQRMRGLRREPLLRASVRPLPHMARQRLHQRCLGTFFSEPSRKAPRRLACIFAPGFIALPLKVPPLGAVEVVAFFGLLLAGFATSTATNEAVAAACEPVAVEGREV